MEFKHLKDILGCPVCLEISLPPIYQCSRCHLICKNCIVRLATPTCPICREQLPPTRMRSFAREHQVEVLQLKCKNYKTGCRQTGKVIDILNHLDDCKFRVANWCQMLVGSNSSCCQEYVLANFPSHVETFHANRFRKCWPEKLFTIKMGAPKSKLARKEGGSFCWDPFFLQTLDENNIFIFSAHYCYSEQQLNMDVYLWNVKGKVGGLTDTKLSIVIETDFCKISRIAKLENVKLKDLLNLLFIQVGKFSVKVEDLFPSGDFSTLSFPKWRVCLNLLKNGCDLEEHMQSVNLNAS